jgi:hypothetical protein
MLGKDRVSALDGLPVGKADRHVIEADGGRDGGWSRVTDAEQPQVVMVLTGGRQEDHHVAHLAGDAKAEQVPIEGE